MSVLFDRYCGLTIGRPGEQGTLFENLRITFQVVKTSDSNPNTAKISIYNLNDNSIGLIEDENQQAVLEAGYNGLGAAVSGAISEERLVGIITKGDVRNVVTTRKGVDRITTFETGDGEDALQSNTLDKSFAPGVTTTDIVREVQGALGVVRGTIKGVIDQIFDNGLSVSGKAKDTMDEITKKMGAEWSIQDGELQILPRFGSTNEEAILLTPDTGLVGAPTRKIGKDKRTSVEFISLLNPRMRPGRKVRIQAFALSGDFVIRKVTMTGDNKQGNFICKCEAS